MSVRDRIRIALALAVLGSCLACTGSGDEPAEASAEQSAAWGEVLRLYEKARQTGETVPADAYDWMKQDLERVGDWEYRVRVFDSAAGAQLEESLNEMGRDRWECFAVVPAGSSLRLLFKRPVESYVGAVPHGDLLKLLRREEGSRGAAPAE